MRIGVVSYGVGNLGSIMRALEELRVQPVLVERPADLRNSDRLLLPGVGNFRDCIRLLEAGGWPEALRDEVLGSHRPLLGVCVGMQLLADASMEGAEEGDPAGVRGLGLVPGTVQHLRTLGCPHRIPHVGWNSVVSHSTGGLFAGIPDGTDFYFVHSYAFLPQDAAHVIATTDYGLPVTAAVQRGHIAGTQFHPEKSSRAGFRLLRNFLQEAGC